MLLVSLVTMGVGVLGVIALCAVWWKVARRKLRPKPEPTDNAADTIRTPAVVAPLPEPPPAVGRATGPMLAAISDSAPDAMIALDRHGNVCAFNSTTATLFECTDLRGAPAAMLFAPEHREAFRRHLGEVVELRGAGVEHTPAHELTALRYDGTQFPVEIFLGRAAPNDRAVVTLVVRDITERQKVDRMKREFISLVSHELRTPLTSIRGSLGLLTTDRLGVIPPKARAMVQIAYSNSERLVRLINDLLDLEKMDRGMMQFTLKSQRLLPLLEHAIEANIGFAEQYHVKIVLQQGAPDVLVRVDPDRLMQVVTNLLSNAVKFSSANDQVTVEVTRRQKTVRVSVTDRGRGIPVEFRASIFQKFAQADSSDSRMKSGSGLGLSIAKAIVEKMGGTISYVSSPGSGSTFFFDLPEQGEADGVIRELMGIERTNPHFRMRSRVLLRVDDRDLASWMVTLLTRGGFKPDVVTCTTELPPSFSLARYAAMVVAMPLHPSAQILPPSLRSLSHSHALPTVLVTDGTTRKGAVDLVGLHVTETVYRPLTESDLVGAVTRAVLAPMVRRPLVLHVENDSATQKVVSGILSDVAETRAASTLEEARRWLHRERFDLILLEPQLSDGSGLALLSLMSTNDEPTVPVVIYSACGVDREVADTVEAALVKSTTSDVVLQSTVASFLRRRCAQAVA